MLTPVDYVFWTRELEGKANAYENSVSKIAGISGKEVWITGKFDKTASKQFEARGWKVKDKANDILLKSKD